jgi:23S rRNA (cytidine1920-2'-O)/16S rRNA (cytidine1409-2'-O)-methyltransferase
VCAPASRAFQKLDHALDAFGLDVTGLRCADFGCNVGGFTDCLLRRGAECVFAVDTAYGQLAWRLRNDPRVMVQERTNALHATPPEGGVDLVVIDLGWTAQRHAVPAGLRWIDAAGTGSIITLIKPHYESSAAGAGVCRGGVDSAEARAICDRVLAELPALGVTVAGFVESPIQGAKSARRGGGNREFLAWLRRSAVAGERL